MTKVIEENSSTGGELPRTSPTQTAVESVMPRHDAERKEAPRQRYHFGMPQAKLSVFNREEGYHYHWLNDTPGRLEMAQATGYEFVSRDSVQLLPGVTPRNSDAGALVSTIVGRGEDGQPLRAYLMRIPNELYEESQAFLQERVDATDSAIRKGKTTGQEGNAFYIPKGAPIQMKNKLGN